MPIKKERGPNGGKRPGSGRKKGVPNKRTLSGPVIKAHAAKKGITPLEFMLQVLRSKSTKYTHQDKMEAARNAAPYVHAKLQSTFQQTSNEGLTHEQWLRRMQEEPEG